MTTPHPQELLTAFPIPKVYWDSLQAALQGQVKRFARDVATSLKQTEQPLLRALAQEKVTAYLFDEEGHELQDQQRMRCEHLVSSDDNAAVLTRCNQPILLGQNKTLCPYHISTKQTPPATQLPLLRRVRRNGDETLWLNESNVLLRPADLKPVGLFKDGKCIVFETST